jgi:hypothetical protein
LSDCNTPFLKSNVAESVTVFGSPDASVGSRYSTVMISPCRTQNFEVSPFAVSNLTSLDACLVLFCAPIQDVVVGHVSDAGPSVYLIPKSSSKIPASGAISVIAPSCLMLAAAIAAAVVAFVPWSITP